MRLAFGASVAVAATLLLAGCEDQHGRDYGRYGGYPGGGYAGYPGDSYGGDAYDSYDDWRGREGRNYGCDGGGCPYYYSDRRDGCGWSECRDPGRRPVVIYDRSRRQYVYVFVPKGRDGNDGVGRGNDDRFGRQGGGWDRPDRNDRQRDVIEQRREDERRGPGDDQLRRRQRDTDERVRQETVDREKSARDQHQERQGRDRDHGQDRGRADQDRGRGDRSGQQGGDQNRGGGRNGGGRDQDQNCGRGRNCSG